MLHGGLEFHNAEALVELDGHPGLLVQRVPEEVRRELNPRARERVRNPDCVELRFVTTGERVRLTLSSTGKPVRIHPIWGDFPAADPIVVGSEPTEIEIVYPERLALLPENATGTSRFHRSVWRLLCTGRGGNLFFHAVEGEGIAPPPKQRCPERTLLTYGTSITHGAAATLAHLSYPYQTARLLGTDLINLGVGGSCHAEAAFADHIAHRDDWQLALLALSVNMVGGGFTAEEFRSRVRYMIERVAGADPGRPVFCVTIFPHVRDLIPGYAMPGDRERPETFRAILAEEAERCDGVNVHLIEGPDILDDPAGLTADLVHPSDFGMTMMAERLAARIREHLPSDTAYR